MNVRLTLMAIATLILLSQNVLASNDEEFQPPVAEFEEEFNQSETPITTPSKSLKKPKASSKIAAIDKSPKVGKKLGAQKLKLKAKTKRDPDFKKAQANAFKKLARSQKAGK